MLTAAGLAHLLGAESAPETAAITGVAFDTRYVQPGDAFFALPGATTHGITFAEEALQRGAVCIVSNEPHERGIVVPDPKHALLTLGRLARKRLTAPVIGITGSVGKTTTRVAAEAAINGRGTPGNYNTPLALAQTLFRAYAQQELRGAKPLVLELGIDHVGEMEQLIALTKPTHAILTTIGHSHLDGLGTIATVAREKLSLLAAVPGLALASMQTAQWIPRELQAGITFVTVTEPVSPIANTPRRLVHGRLRNRTLYAIDQEITLPHGGFGVAHAALLGLVLAQQLGVPVAKAAKRISAAPWEGGRLERLQVGNVTVLNDSYNSNPLSVREALHVLAAEPGEHHVVFGTMAELGERAVMEHEAAAKLLTNMASVALVGEATTPMLATLPRAQFFPDVQALIAGYSWPTSGTLLIKGSRSVQLERAVATLLEHA